VGLILFSAFGMGQNGSLVYLITADIILGLGEAIELSTWNAIIADQTDAANRDSAFSLSFVVSSVSTGIGSAIPISFPTIETMTRISPGVLHLDFVLFFFGLSIISPVMMAVLLRGYVEHIAEKKMPEKIAAKKKSNGGGMKFLLKFSGINSLIGLGAGFIIPLIPTWLFLKFSVPDSYSGPLLAVSSITFGFASLASPRLSKRYGIVNSIVMTEGLSTIFMLSLAFIPNAVLAAGAYVVRASLMNMASPLSDSFLMGNLSPERRGLASALNSIIWRLPNSASTIAGGVILQNGNYSLPFFLAAGFYAMSILLFYTNFRNTKTARNG
jgi:MFS family permease